MLTLTYEFKLIPDNRQIEVMEHTLNVCRSVWNYALRERKDWLNSRKSPVNACSLVQEYIISADVPYPTYHNQAKALTEAKKTNEILKSVNAQVLQQVLRTLDRSFGDMQSKKLGVPRFKNRYRMRSYVYPQMLKDCVQGNQIKLPQLGWVKFRKSREIPDGFEIKQARIVRRASGHCRLRNKQKASNNRHKLNQKIARLHQQISDTRKDWHFKLAHHLCDQAQSIFIEDIDFRSWGRGMLSKHCLDAAFGQFVTILKWVAWKRDVFVAEVDKNYTSQICPNCGSHTGKKSLNQREHNCPECGYKTHRDVAAAQVIRNRGREDALGHSVL